MPYRIRRSRCPIGFWGPDALLDSEIKMPYWILRSHYLLSEKFHFREACRRWEDRAVATALCTGLMKAPQITLNGERVGKWWRMGSGPTWHERVWCEGTAPSTTLQEGRGDEMELRGSCGIMCIYCYLNKLFVDLLQLAWILFRELSRSRTVNRSICDLNIMETFYYEETHWPHITEPNIKLIVNLYHNNGYTDICSSWVLSGRP